MKYSWLDEYIGTKKGVQKEYKAEWGVHRYMLSDKMIGMLGKDNEDRNIITLKCEPSFGEFLREQFDDVYPGYYMNKVHWNSLDMDGKVPDNILKEMIDQSYSLILQSFSKKKQAQIQEL